MRRFLTSIHCLPLLFSLALSTISKAQTGQIPVFYVAAHPDDIQLFIGNQAAADASNESVRSVWVIATAGNADRDNNWWWAREQGAVASMERALGWVQGSFPSGCYQSKDSPTINGHTIARYRLTDGAGRIRSALYCMRLPDGNGDGSGFPLTSYESLYKLVNGKISAMHTVDGTATYSGIRDVMLTLDKIVSSERNATSPNSHPWLNANEYSGMRNINDATEDHTDHRVLGSLLASFAHYNGFNRLWWISYTVRSGGGYTTLTGADLANKEAVYFAGTHAMDTMLTFFNAQPYPQGQNWSWSGTNHELGDHDSWWAHWFEFGPVMRVVTRTHDAPDLNNHYPLPYPKIPGSARPSR